MTPVVSPGHKFLGYHFVRSTLEVIKFSEVTVNFKEEILYQEKVSQPFLFPLKMNFMVTLY